MSQPETVTASDPWDDPELTQLTLVYQLVKLENMSDDNNRPMPCISKVMLRYSSALRNVVDDMIVTPTPEQSIDPPNQSASTRQRITFVPKEELGWMGRQWLLTVVERADSKE